MNVNRPPAAAHADNWPLIHQLSIAPKTQTATPSTSAHRHGWMDGSMDLGIDLTYIRLLAKLIRQAKPVTWNGPLATTPSRKPNQRRRVVVAGP